MTHNDELELKDYGPLPFAENLHDAALANDNYRTTLWTGEHVQITLMAIPAGGGDIGMEKHHDNDQIIYMFSGVGRVKMGKDKNKLTVDKEVHAGDVVIIPDDTWHNVINAGDETMKVFSVYSPVKHAKGTNETTKADAIDKEGPLEGTQN